MINSVDHDGDKRGYDLELIGIAAGGVSIPVIAMGGVREWPDLVSGIVDGRADAVAAGNVFHYTEHSTKKAKEHMFETGLNVRPPTFYKVDMPRRPKYKPF
jgi:cyclase